MFTCWILCLTLSVATGKGLLTKGWDTGSSHKYIFSTTLLFKEVSSSKVEGGDVGFRLTGTLRISTVWRDPTDDDQVLLKFDLISPQLWIKSRKAPEPEGFVEHSSTISETASKPALALWRHGEVRALYLDKSDGLSSTNLKRGLVSLFQYRTLDDEGRERDASGYCTVNYISLGPKHIMKKKHSCKWNDLLLEEHRNPIYGVNVTSNHVTIYKLSYNLMPKKIKDEENHEMRLVAATDVGASVSYKRTLEELAGEVGKSEFVSGLSIEEALNELYPKYVKTDIELQLEPIVCPESGCQTLETIIQENEDGLSNKAMGTAKSGLALLKILPSVKEISKPEQLMKILKNPQYTNFRNQIFDIFGTASTPIVHQAAMKVLKTVDTADEFERYLWALSLSPTPHIDIIKDVLKQSEETLPNDKVSETLALTAAAMARNHGSKSLIETVRISLTIGLESCSGDECRIKFLRALRNLQSEKSIPTLLNWAINGTKTVSLTAWNALSKLPKEYIDNEIKRIARTTFLQSDGIKRDSSVRAFALNIILENCSNKDELEELIKYLIQFDSAYEIRKYLGQRLDQLSQSNEEFSYYLKETHRYNNYHVRTQKGLSTAFTRKFLESNASNGSLVTIQEINSGLLKRGVVDVVLKSNNYEETVFSLGLFAGGLSSFVSSDQDNELDNEIATAGMEIGLSGVAIRPFRFFSGQGELMSHLWSGTASERTPALELSTSLHNYKQVIPLGCGFVAEIDVQGALSFNLAGQIQVSLWSRNAQSMVDLSAGIAVLGGIKTRSSFVQSQAEFSMTFEPKLDLSTDADFSGPVALCMRLSQPETIVKYQFYKVERIPGSRHRLRKTRKSKFLVPAKSYFLNKKNNEMCSKLFS